MQKESRQRRIRELIDSEAIASQEQLVSALTQAGVSATQSSVCRDLREIDAVKVGGRYQIRRSGFDPALAGSLRSFVREVLEAGPHLLVVKTAIGTASRVGLAIDQSGWPGVVGTVAGDDTLFVAISGKKEQRKIMALLRAAE